MLKRIVLALGMLILTTPVAFSQGSCWKDPCPFQSGVGAVCRVVLNQNGSCSCVEMGTPPHQFCQQSNFDCFAQLEHGGCRFGLSAPRRKAITQTLRSGKGPFKVYAQSACINGALGDFWKKEAAKYHQQVTFVSTESEVAKEKLQK